MPEQLIRTLHDIKAIQFGHFELKNGDTSNIYINLRKIVSYPYILKYVASLMWSKISDHQFDLLCGVPYTALPIATCLSLNRNIPMIMRRKEKKEYGTKQKIEGHFSEGQTTLIIEDVITSGSSILETIYDLEQEGLTVKNCVALIDRQSTRREELNAYSVHACITLERTMRILLEKENIEAYEKTIIEQLLSDLSNKK